MNRFEYAKKIHSRVPPDWYYRSIKENLFQRYWHRIRFEEVAKLIKPIEGSVLDIGSADGVFSKVIFDKTKAKNLIGIDILKDSVDWANNHFKKDNKMRFIVADAHKLPFPNISFSAVFALEVLEHVANPDLVLKEIKRVLKNSGYVILLVPTESLLFRIVWYFWCFYRGRIWKGTHIQTYQQDSLAEVCRRNGFIIVKQQRFLLGMLEAVVLKK